MRAVGWGDGEQKWELRFENPVLWSAKDCARLPGRYRGRLRDRAELVLTVSWQREWPLVSRAATVAPGSPNLGPNLGGGGAPEELPGPRAPRARDSEPCLRIDRVKRLRSGFLNLETSGGLF